MSERVKELGASRASSDAAEDAAPMGLSSLDEPVLADDYPIYGNYLYVADGKVVMSDWHNITARQFRAYLGVSELRRCDIYGRRELAARAKAEGAP